MYGGTDLFPFRMRKKIRLCGTTVTGKVTSVKDSTVTLTLGELTESEEEDSRPDMQSDTTAPTAYSTANITVAEATLTANNSEALVIEDKNSTTLENCIVTGNKSDTKGSDENVHNVMIYQSMGVYVI